MRILAYSAFGFLILASSWMALYSAVISETRRPGSDWQLLSSVATAEGPHSIVVGPVDHYESVAECNRHEDESHLLLTETKFRGEGIQPANRAVTSSGTVVYVHEFRQLDKARFRPQLASLRSLDSGLTFEQAIPISKSWWHDAAKCSDIGKGFSPLLAADPGSKKFSEYVYCVWIDGNHDEQRFMLFSSSPNNGASWTKPAILSATPLESTVITAMPSLAVNQDGVIGVAWHERRITSDAKEKNANKWNIQFRTSLDGGATWLPSAQVNEEPVADTIDELQTIQILATAEDAFSLVHHHHERKSHQAWIASVE